MGYVGGDYVARIYLCREFLLEISILDILNTIKVLQKKKK